MRSRRKRAKGSEYSATMRMRRPSGPFKKVLFSYARGAEASGGGAPLPGSFAGGGTSAAAGDGSFDAVPCAAFTDASLFITYLSLKRIASLKAIHIFNNPNPEMTPRTAPLAA